MNQHFAKNVAWLSKTCGLMGCAILLFGGTAPSAHAQVLVSGFYNQTGTNFLYTFQVQNTSGVDVSVINVLFPTQRPVLAITGETAPGDFLFDYDSGSLVFAEGTVSGTFLAGTTVSGFSLTSNVLLTPDSIEAFDATSLNPVTATFSSVAVPEVGTLSLTLLVGSALLGTIITRRRVVA